MTPEEHIKQAEAIAARAQAHYDDGLLPELQGYLLLGVLHALIALAVEGGVPHSTPAPEGA